MATPRPRRGARGRPRNPESESAATTPTVPDAARKSVGRPPKSFAEDPSRWEMALIGWTVQEHSADGFSPLRAISSYVTWHALARGEARIRLYAHEELETEHRRKQPGFWVDMTAPPPKLLEMLKAKHDKDSDWDYDSENAFRPEIISVEKKLRRIRRADPSRFQIMIDAWTQFAIGNLDAARLLVASINDVQFFDHEWRRLTRAPALCCEFTARFGYPLGSSLRDSITFGESN
jgi:hypothetical protein